MAKTIAIVVVSGAAAVLFAALFIALYHYAEVIRNVREHIAGNIEFCVFLYYFVDEKTRAVSLEGLSNADIRNIMKMKTIRDLTENGVIAIENGTLSVSKGAYAYLRAYTGSGEKKATGKAAFGEELLHSLKLPHITDKYAAINFDLI